MQLKSTIIKIIICFCFFLALTFISLQGCGSIDRFHQIKDDPGNNQLYPFHLIEPTKKQKTFHYSFKQVWNASNMLLNEKKESYEKEGFDARIFSDEKSGVLCLTIVMNYECTSFVSNILFIKSLDKNITKLYSQKVYYRYLNWSGFGMGRYVLLTDDFNEFDDYFEKLNTISE